MTKDLNNSIISIIIGIAIGAVLLTILSHFINSDNKILKIDQLDSTKVLISQNPDIADTLSLKEGNIYLLENKSLNNNKNLADIIFGVSIVFISLIVAIVAWVGVGNVTEVMNIKKEMDVKLISIKEKENNLEVKSEEVDNGLEDLKFHSNNNSKMIENNKNMLEYQRLINALILLNSDFNYNERIGALQYLLQNPSFAKIHKSYLNEIYNREIKLKEKLEEKDPNNEVIISLFERLFK